MAGKIADKIGFELVAPERLLLSKQVEMVGLPGTEGRFGVLPGHSAVIATLRSGVVEVYEGGKISEKLFIGGGFAEVSAERCVVLAEMAVPVSEINRADVARRVEELKATVKDTVLTPDADPSTPAGELVLRLAMLDAVDSKAAAHH